MEPLPVTMSAVRMGERVLQIGVDDPTIASAIAAKVGLSGNAAIAVTDERDAARALVREAERALKHTPALLPPLFAARMLHDRAVVALALGRREEGLSLLLRAEESSRHGAIPCARMRLLEDLLDVLPLPDPRRDAIFAEANETSAARKLHPRRWRAV